MGRIGGLRMSKKRSKVFWVWYDDDEGSSFLSLKKPKPSNIYVNEAFMCETEQDIGGLDFVKEIFNISDEPHRIKITVEDL